MELLCAGSLGVKRLTSGCAFTVNASLKEVIMMEGKKVVIFGKSS
jgi:hypothetical protein